MMGPVLMLLGLGAFLGGLYGTWVAALVLGLFVFLAGGALVATQGQATERLR